MDEFVTKLESGDDVSETINKLNRSHKKLHHTHLSQLSNAGSKTVQLMSKGSFSNLCDLKLGEMYVNNVSDLEMRDELTELHLDESDVEKCKEVGINCVSVGSILSNKDSERWLLDSGSTVHLTNNKFLLKNITATNTNVTVGTGTTVQAYTKGDVKLIQGNSGNVIILKDVLYVPSFNQHILSIPKLLQEGYNIHGNKTSLKLVALNKNTIATNVMDSQNMFYLEVSRGEINKMENQMLMRNKRLKLKK